MSSKSFTSWMASRGWSDFVTHFQALTRFEASPGAQWAKDRPFFSSTSQSSMAKHHMFFLGMASWCEKHHLFTSFT